VASKLGKKYSAKIHSFLLLFILFVIALEFYDPEKINLMEKVFMVYASGFCLEKLAAMQEHGLLGKQFRIIYSDELTLLKYTYMELGYVWLRSSE
jgi:hypothetical protein